MSSFELRPPQQKCCAQVYRDLRDEVDSTLAVVSTGVGKTIIASALSSRWINNDGKRILFLAHRDELIRQAAQKMWDSRRLHAQIEKADERASIGHSLVVGSVQTMQGDRLNRWPTNSFDIIITDEAHRSVAQTYLNVYERFANAQRLGLTATAYRQKGSLAQVYDHVSFEYKLKQAIADGYLCRLTAQTIPLNIDLGKLGSRGGDFSVEEVEEKIDPYIEKIAAEVWKRASGRKIMLFAPTCKTARKCAEIFEQRGFRSYYAGGDDRSQVPAFEADGYGSIMCNSMLLTEGYDHPQIDCIIILRITKSTGLYCQMVGRGTRLFVGKKDCLILDFLWNSENHNLCKPSCLIAEDDEQEEKMGQILDKSGAPMDLVDDVDVAAVSEIRCERERKLADSLRSFTGRDSKKFDPVLESLAIGDSRLANWKAETNWEKAEMTNGQERFLKDQGFDPSGWCKGYASSVINDLESRRKEGLCTPKMMRTLMKNGHPEAGEYTFQQAKDAMNKLSKKWDKAARWKNIKQMRHVK